jgi:predicted dehydrogenase
MSELKVAILGCGRMGKERARCVTQLGARVVAVGDIESNRANALAAAYGARVLPIPGAFADSGVDAIFVCTPPNNRGILELAAIRSNVAFFVEKPIGVSLATSLPVLEELRKTPVIHAVGYMNRHRASVRHARCLLSRSTVLGISVYWVGKSYQVPWWLDPTASGGPHNEQATHAFDLCRFLVGEISSVRTTFQRIAADRQPLAAASSVGFECGSVGSIFYSCQADAKDIGARVFAAAGSIAFSGWDLRMTENTIDGTAPETQSDDVFLVETETFLRAVETGRQELVACDWSDAMGTQAALDAARDSAGVLSPEVGVAR